MKNVWNECDKKPRKLVMLERVRAACIHGLGNAYRIENSRKGWLVLLHVTNEVGKK